jgi:hypothetical protein
MVATCVNPKCHSALHSFSEGRLYQFEIVSISVSASDDNLASFDEKPERQTAQFWLCGRCAATMHLTLEPMTGLKLMPISPEMSGLTGFRLEGEVLPDLNNC